MEVLSRIGKPGEAQAQLCQSSCKEPHLKADGQFTTNPGEPQARERWELLLNFDPFRRHFAISLLPLGTCRFRDPDRPHSHEALSCALQKKRLNRSGHAASTQVQRDCFTSEVEL